MKGLEVSLHSFVDVITNSSTTIYTFSESSVEPAKKLVNAFAKLMGYPKAAEEMFFFECFPSFHEQWDSYVEAKEEDELTEEDKAINAMSYGDRQLYFSQLKLDICMNKKERPHWLDEDHSRWGDDYIESKIFIYPKDAKYQEVADKLKEFLYSTSHEARYDG